MSAGTSDRLTAGVIGAGSVAETAHLPTYAERSDVDLVAITELADEVRERMAKEYDVPRSYADASELLASEELDLVSICTPPSTHEEMFVSAVERGANVYCEKPMTTDLESARRMRDAADRAGVITQVGYTRPYVENYRKVLAMTSKDLLGGLQRLDTYRVRNPPGAAWYYDPSVSGGGVVSDQLPHILDYYMRLFGDTDPIVRSSTLRSLDLSEVTDFAEIEFEFAGTTVRTTLAWSQGAHHQRNVLLGSKGSVEFNMEMLTGQIQGNEFQMKYGSLPTVDVDGLLRLWRGGTNTFHEKRVNDFVDHVAAGEHTTVASVQRGFEVTRTIQEIYERADDQ